MVPRICYLLLLLLLLQLGTARAATTPQAETEVTETTAQEPETKEAETTAQEPETEEAETTPVGTETTAEATTEADSSSSSSDGGSTSTEPSDAAGGLSVGQLAAIALSSLLLVGVMATVAVYLVRRRRGRVRFRRLQCYSYMDAGDEDLDVGSDEAPRISYDDRGISFSSSRN